LALWLPNLWKNNKKKKKKKKEEEEKETRFQTF